MTFGAHATIGQNLGDSILGAVTLLQFISLAHGGNKIFRVVVGDELKCVCNALNQVVLFDIGHGYLLNSTLLVRFDLF